MVIAGAADKSFGPPLMPELSDLSTAFGYAGMRLVGLLDMVEGKFVHPIFCCVRFRAERNEDGSIWSIEVLDARGDCLDIVDFPDDRASTERAFTNEGAKAVIVELLTARYSGHPVVLNTPVADERKS